MLLDPSLQEGVLEDNGTDRGLMFVFTNTWIGRQFEFVQSEWVNNGIFVGSAGDKDPIVGAGDDTGKLIVPRKPVRRSFYGLPRFVMTRGVEHGFMPGLVPYVG